MTTRAIEATASCPESAGTPVTCPLLLTLCDQCSISAKRTLPPFGAAVAAVANHQLSRTERADLPPAICPDQGAETSALAECRAFRVAYVHADHRAMSAPMGGIVRFLDADSRAPATSATSQRRLIMLHIDRGVSVRFGARAGRLSPEK